MRRASQLALLTVLLGDSAFAARYALLIGAGQFPNAPGVHALAGPPNDVEALRAELIRSWEVPATNIQVLLNAGAGRKEILAALDSLVKVAAKDDVVLIYYSGHGTSAHDPGSSHLGMNANTGAIVPADIKIGKDVAPGSIFTQLIVGNNDLRPRLSQLDTKGAQVLVLFDACYSGDTAKSLERLTPRNADLLADIAAPGSIQSFDEALKTADLATDGWPYQHVVYISAATRYEVAWDISDAMAKSERPTIDGKAHGAFTNALLRGLQGAADTNHDGKITYAELHGFLVEQLQRNGQTPQLHPTDKSLVLEPILASAHAPQAAAAASPSGLRIRLDNAEPLRAGLANLDNVHIADDGFDISVQGPGPRYRLTRADGGAVAPDPLAQDDVLQLLRKRAQTQRLLVRLVNAEPLRAGLTTVANVKIADASYDIAVRGPAPRYHLMHAGGGEVTAEALSQDEVLQSIRRRALAQRLLTLQFPRQDFNVALSMTPDRGAYFAGERITVNLQPERESWLLMTDLDTEGNVFLIYPHEQADFRKIRAGEKVTAVQVEVSAPFGTDILQTFAFSEKPEGYDKLAGAVQLTDEQVRNLIASVEKNAASPGRSRVQRITFTSKKK